MVVGLCGVSDGEIDGVTPVKSIESGVYAGSVQKYDSSDGVSSDMFGAGAEQHDGDDIE